MALDLGCIKELLREVFEKYNLLRLNISAQFNSHLKNRIQTFTNCFRCLYYIIKINGKQLNKRTQDNSDESHWEKRHQ